MSFLSVKNIIPFSKKCLINEFIKTLKFVKYKVPLYFKFQKSIFE